MNGHTTSTRDAGAPRRLKVLAVEDNPAVRLLIAHTLKRIYEVETASTYDEALAKAASHLFDVLVLDINLCDTRDGVALLHAIRQVPAYRAVPAIACTAYARSVERDHFLNAGFDAYISKPFTKEGLLEVVAYMLGEEADQTEVPAEVMKERSPIQRGAAEQILEGGRVVRRFV